MTMILRIPVQYTNQSTRVVHYISTTIWYNSLYKRQLKLTVKAHGVGYDNDGWIWSE